MSLTSAYSKALLFTKAHYENFPVVSLFIPQKLRKHIAVVYQFARQADDIADEGKSNCEMRIENLELYETELKNCLSEKYSSNFWMALNYTINHFNLSRKYFFDLLSAFKQDVIKYRYQTFNEVLDYCSRSANPVGRIILELFNIRNEDIFKYSDSICTGLQLTNFYQDISIDIKNNRNYIPKDEMINFGVPEIIFELKENNANFKQLLKYQVDRTKQLFENGRRIIPHLPRSLRMQIKLTILGGERILMKIQESDYNTLLYRPTLSRKELIKIFIKALT